MVGSRTMTPPMMRGTPVSSGIAHGTAYVLACADHAAAPRRAIGPEEVEGEGLRFERAVAKAEKDLLALTKTVADKIGSSEAEIFAAQALVVTDAGFHNQVLALVREKAINVEAALAEVVEKFTRAFDA